MPCLNASSPGSPPAGRCRSQAARRPCPARQRARAGRPTGDNDQGGAVKDFRSRPLRLGVEAEGEGGPWRGFGEAVFSAEATDGGAGSEEFGGVLTPDVVRDVDANADDSRGP